MRVTGKSGFALFLIGCGALILMGKFGFHFGHLMSYIIPLAMLLVGYLGWQRGRKMLGGLLMVFGSIVLLGKLTGLIGLIIAVAMIAYGVSMFRKNSVL